MLTSLVKASVEEISWDGPPGVSWPKLLCRLRAAGFQMDHHTRPALWAEICSNKTPIIVHGRRNDQPPHDAETEDSDDRECRRSRSQRNKGKLVLSVPDAVRWHCLRLDAHPDIAENELSRRCLQLVAQRRWKGCQASMMASELNVTAANLFYPLEGLRMAGLLVGVLTLPSKATASDSHGNLFYFSRFFDPESVEHNEVQILLRTSAGALANKILSTLNSTEAKVAFEGGLRAVLAHVLEESGLKPDITRRAAGRIYQRLRSDMVSSGKVECVRAWDPGSRTFKDALCIPGHTGQPEPILAIADVPATEAGNVAQVPAAPDEHFATKEHPLPESVAQAFPTAACLRSSERSVAQQAQDLIRCCSRFGRGITGPDVCSMLGTRRKQAERILNTLVKRKRVIRVFESDGKAHANRYFDSPEACADMCNISQASKKHALRLSDGRGNKALKTRSSGRIDVTFVRRIQRTSELLERIGVLTTFDLRKAGMQDDVLGCMDSKTPAKILKAVASTEKRVGIAVTETDHIEFAFWKPTHTESSARQVAQQNAEMRKETRFQKIRRVNEKPKPPSPLALLNQPWPCRYQGPSAPPWKPMSRRVLSEDIVAERVTQPGKLEAVGGVPRTLDQKVGS